VSLKAGIVVIGRNEGDRLGLCLDSVLGLGAPVVYVDSASTDGSAGRARSRGCLVVELDASAPLGAARARNEGFRRLAEAHPDVEAVQFVDGDCVLDPGWLAAALDALAARPELAVVCGRLREAHPEASVYNRLCDMEWNGPVGEIEACGGVAAFRASAFRAAGGFNAALGAGEEPELCRRLRAAGGRVARLDREMGRHDAAMTRLGQWWRRCVRGGYGAAQSARLPGGGDPAAARRNASAVFWAGILPLAAVLPAWPTRGASLLLLAAYPLLALKVAAGRRRRGDAWGGAAAYAFFCVLAKLPHLAGWMKGRASAPRGLPAPMDWKGGGA
jgi:hypothetical protein